MEREVVGYYRTSSLSNVGSDKDSRKRQRHSVLSFTKSNGMKLVEEFYDEGVSGTLDVMNRPQFLSMLSFCEKNGIDTICFESSDRMSRDLLIMETGFHYLSNLGYKLISVSNPDTFIEITPTGTLIRQVLGVISQFEKSNLVDKLRVSRERKSLLNKSRGYISRSGRGKVEGRKFLTQLYPQLEELVVSYRRVVDKRTRKPLSYMKISNLLMTNNDLSVSFNSVKRILDDVKMKKREERNRKRRRSTIPSY